MFYLPTPVAEKDLFTNQFSGAAHSQYQRFLNGQQKKGTGLHKPVKHCKILRCWEEKLPHDLWEGSLKIFSGQVCLQKHFHKSLESCFSSQHLLLLQCLYHMFLLFVRSVTFVVTNYQAESNSCYVMGEVSLVYPYTCQWCGNLLT